MTGNTMSTETARCSAKSDQDLKPWARLQKHTLSHLTYFPFKKTENWWNLKFTNLPFEFEIKIRRSVWVYLSMCKLYKRKNETIPANLWANASYKNLPEQGILQRLWGPSQCSSNSHVNPPPDSKSKETVFSLFWRFYFPIQTEVEETAFWLKAQEWRSFTCIWSITDLAELSEIPRSAEGPPQMTPTLRTLSFSFSVSSFAMIPSSTTSAAARGTPAPRHHRVA